MASTCTALQQLLAPVQLAVLDMGGTINGIIGIGDPDPAPASSRVIAYVCQHAAAHRYRCEESTCAIVAMKDSRAVDEGDRRALARAISATAVQRILVPHGTFTMAATGCYLERHFSLLQPQPQPQPAVQMSGSIGRASASTTPTGISTKRAAIPNSIDNTHANHNGTSTGASTSTITGINTAGTQTATAVAHTASNGGNKCVVLVGSLVPLGEPGSDAPANLGFALAQLRAAPPGIWVAMQGRLWCPGDVEKDSTTGAFVAKL